MEESLGCRTRPPLSATWRHHETLAKLLGPAFAQQLSLYLLEMSVQDGSGAQRRQSTSMGRFTTSLLSAQTAVREPI
jgi:hypothetical protein